MCCAVVKKNIIGLIKSLGTETRMSEARVIFFSIFRVTVLMNIIEFNKYCRRFQKSALFYSSREYQRKRIERHKLNFSFKGTGITVTSIYQFQEYFIRKSVVIYFFHSAC